MDLVRQRLQLPIGVRCVRGRWQYHQRYFRGLSRLLSQSFQDQVHRRTLEKQAPPLSSLPILHTSRDLPLRPLMRGRMWDRQIKQLCDRVRISESIPLRLWSRTLTPHLPTHGLTLQDRARLQRFREQTCDYIHCYIIPELVQRQWYPLVSQFPLFHPARQCMSVVDLICWDRISQRFVLIENKIGFSVTTYDTATHHPMRGVPSDMVSLPGTWRSLHQVYVGCLYHLWQQSYPDLPLHADTPAMVWRVEPRGFFMYPLAPELQTTHWWHAMQPHLRTTVDTFSQA